MFDAAGSRATSCAQLLLLLMLLPLVGCLHRSSDAEEPAEHAGHNASSGALNENATSTEAVRSREEKHVFLGNVYGPWSEWSACSKKCQQSRKRLCKKERHCGKSHIKEKRNCKSHKNCLNKTRKKRMKLIGLDKNGKFVKQVLYKYLYGQWTQWSSCSKNCRKERRRMCIEPLMCGSSYLQEERVCKRTHHKCRKQYILRDGDIQNKIKDILVTSKNRTIKTGPTVSKKSTDVLSELATDCGIQPGPWRGSYRVVGGRESRKHAWPWQVAILEKHKDQFCGGTLIAPQWVLTAAHCVRKRNKRRKILVRVGDHNIIANEIGEMKVKLEKDFPHHNYDFDTITNDIALLKLEYPVNKSSTVDFACLPKEDENLEENVGRSKQFKHRNLCYIIGWGKERNTDIHGSKVLREAQVPIVNRETCKKAFPYDIHKTQLCAGNRRGGIDSCAGDSGGPLLCRVQDHMRVHRWVVYGVTSYGEGCGEKKKYGIYTNVRKYLDWINEIIKNN